MGDLKLRSSPPMGEAELLGLIGGNSLTGLAGGGGAALATVVGQSLLVASDWNAHGCLWTTHANRSFPHLCQP